MRSGFFVIFLILSHQVFSQVVLWNETFDDLSNGTVVDNGSTAWSVSYGGRGRFNVRSNTLEAFYMDGIGTWTSEEIPISSVNYAEISMDINWFGGGGFSNPDIIRVYYKLDGGPAVLFYENILTNFISSGGSATLSKVLKGDKVQIVIESYNDFGQTFFSYSYNSFDNIQVKEVTTLYSRNTGIWSDGNNWSAQDFSGPQSAAGYYPTRTEGAIIGNGNTINLSDTHSTSFLEVHNNGTLNMNSHTLNMERGGGVLVESGGKIQNSNSNSILEFTDPFVTDLVVDDVNGLNIGRLNLQDNVTLNVSGSGTIKLNNNFEFDGDDISVDMGVPITVSGNITSTGSNNSITNQDEFTWSGSAWDNDVTLSNGASSIFNYTRNGNQTVVAPQNYYYTLNMSGSGTKTAQGAIEVNENITVNGSATFSMASNNLTLAGNLTNNGTSSVTNIGRLTFDGTTDQNINGTSSSNQISVTGFTLNKTVGTSVVLSRTLNVTNGSSTDAIFNSGTIKSSSTYLVTMADGASSGGGNVNSFIDGPMIKTGNDVFVFPIGRNGYFAPIGMFGLRNYDNLTQFSAEYVNALPPLFDQLVSGLARISGLEYWNLERISDSGNDAGCYVTLYYMDADNSQITDPSDLTVSHYSGILSLWEDLGAGSSTSNSISSSNRTFNFSPFTFGSAGGTNPLPVELKDFNAEYNDGNVSLSWTTATELNNDYFTLERSGDGLNYQEIGTVKGHGTSPTENSYSFTDRNYSSGNNYYRLKQTDFDGTTEIFKPVYLNIPISESSSSALVVYPNPVSAASHSLNLGLRDFKYQGDSMLEVSVINSLGKRILSRQFYARDLNDNLQVDLGGDITAGIYFVNLKNGSSSVTEKFIVK